MHGAADNLAFTFVSMAGYIALFIAAGRLQLPKMCTFAGWRVRVGLL